jgi:hypothetical protein
MSHRFRPVLTAFGLLGKDAMTPVIETYELSPMQAGMLFHAVELFWPQVDHTYTLELHRRRLMKEIKTWATAYIRS